MNKTNFRSDAFQRTGEPARENAPSPPAPADDEIDLLALLHTLWRGKWIIMAVTALALLAGGYYAFVAATPKYTASATVVLDSRDEQIVDLTNVVSGLSGNQETLNTEVEVLSSRGLAEELVKRLDLLSDPEFNASLRPQPMLSLGRVVTLVKAPFVALGVLEREVEEPLSERAELDATIDAVLTATSVSNVRQSYVFRVTVESEAPEKSALMADTLAEVYIDDQLAVKFAATEKATEWLTDQVSELRANLEAAEEKVKNFNATTTLISPEALEVLNRQMKDLRERIANADAAAAAARARVAEFEAARISGSIAIMSDVALDPVLDRLVEQGAPDEAVLARFSTLAARADAERARAVDQVEALTASATDLEARIEAQSNDLVELRQLEREAEASGTIYAYFLSRLKETSVQQGIQQADSRILSHAVVPRSASEPRKSLVLALAGLLGLMAGAALVLGREAAANTFRTTDDLAEFTGYPVMGSIPRIPTRSRQKTVDYVISKPSSAPAEAVRNLRTSIMLSNVDRPPQVILSTSAIPSEGKSTQSILLAQNFSAIGKRVLLVEGDMRRRVFPQYFDVAPSKDAPSLVSVLTGATSLQDAVLKDSRYGFDILPSSDAGTNAGDLYTSDRFQTLVQEMRDTYDVVIFDTPPVLVVPDARIIANTVDAVIFAVRWDSTKKSTVREGLQMLASVGVRVSGLVLTQVDPSGMKRYGYGSYYGAYRGYYGT